MAKKILPVLQCNPILVTEKAKKETPEIYQQLADEYYKTDIGGTEFVEKYSQDIHRYGLAKSIVALR